MLDCLHCLSWDLPSDLERSFLHFLHLFCRLFRRKLFGLEPAPHVFCVIEQGQQAYPLNRAEPESDVHIGLERVASQAERHVSDHEPLECIARAAAASNVYTANARG